ncbi:MAG TPA: UDP-N-acetylmuramate dehydrogenase [Syntrophales bacterium]|nr:UDP-N-acetylmuramate dehydrogenase [Syntrophales bacterium]
MMAGDLRKKLQEILSEDVLFDEPLSRHTSLGVGGEADAVVFPRNGEELTKILSCLKKEGTPFTPVGNGTNLIVRDGGYRGVVVSLKRFHNLGIEDDDGGRVSVHAEAGVPLAELVGLSLREGLTGVEFCAGIPGSVGGAIRMNAGAYGREIKDVVETITFMTINGGICHYGRGELGFSYRNLDLPPDSVILSAHFFLPRGAREEIKKNVETILEMRKEKHPLMYPNAGSIFKNPGSVSAGRIIDELGLKGLKIGDAMISETHGNFIVNLDKAKAKDVLALIDVVKNKVLEERGVVLDTEVHIIGERDDDF